MKIIYVNRDHNSRTLAQRLLDENTYVASSGQEALELLNKHSDVGAVFTDVLIGQMSGYELARNVKDGYDIPVVAVTTENPSTMAKYGAKSLFDKVITGFDDVDEFLAVASRYIS